MLAEDLDRIARCLFPDPHTVLGPHAEGAGAVVRVLRPGATAVRILGPGANVVSATRVHASGVFVAALPSLIGARDYRVEETRPDGTKLVGFDPYAFGPTLGDIDLHLFAEGKHRELHKRLGARVLEHEGVLGVAFAVWAPAALSVRVVGDFNDWRPEVGAMRRLSGGAWELFVPDAHDGSLYKFQVMTRRGPLDKSDPFGRAMELRPNTASRVVESRHVFEDAAWMEARATRKHASAPMSIYEVHLPSWRRPARPPGAADDELAPFPTYRELATELVDYVAELGFTHIELMPVLEHPYDGSWGYQVSGYFAPTARLGTPDDLRFFIDRCHQRNIGVILDWVPAHFPRDASALGRFDGTPLYEHWDPRRGEHRQWETFVFDWGRPEVKNFLLASALYWIEEFHIDGLRVDAVASMLYLDYGSSGPHDWEPNIHGGRENLEAVAFLRELNELVHTRCPGVLVTAEESTSWPGVTRPPYTGGLGFDLKWNMGWMHDTLDYFALDPIFRAFRHTMVTFSMMYAYSERYLLPLSHDEVVHLKRSLLGKMPGDDAARFSTLRSLYASMWAHPGRKLLFMGGEIAQETEWAFARELDWHVLEHPRHKGVQRLVRDLNRLYREHPAMHARDDHSDGYLWIDANDAPQSVLSFMRFEESRLRKRRTGRFVVVVASYTPVIRERYRIGVPRGGAYLEVLNTDATVYGGAGIGNLGRVVAEPVPSHGHPFSLVLTLPPLAVLYLVPEDAGEATPAEIEAEARELEEQRAKEAAATASDALESEPPPADSSPKQEP
ncbi:MAG: 1,4-alpha-glucan branching protein GlgB [Polyangiaceae bacterium]